MVPSLLRKVREDERLAFLAAGAFNTAFGFSLFVVLELTLGRVAPYLLVLLVSHVIAVLVAFVVYRKGVFKVEGNVLVDLLRFQSVYVVALGINLALLPLLVEAMGLSVIPAQAMVLVVTAAVSFVGHKHFSFRRSS